MSGISYRKRIEFLEVTDLSNELFSVWLNLKFGLFGHSMSFFFSFFVIAFPLFLPSFQIFLPD